MPRACLSALLLAATLATSGCGDLPVVGNLGEKIKPILPGFVRERLFGPDDASTTQAASVPSDRPHRRRVRMAQMREALKSAGASQSVDPQVVFDHYVTTNTEFDHLRTEGIEALYSSTPEGTVKAVGYFKQAQQKRPNDKNIQDLIQLAEHPEQVQGAQGAAGGPAGAAMGGAAAGNLPVSPGGGGPLNLPPNVHLNTGGGGAQGSVNSQVPVLPSSRVPFPHGR